MKYYDNPAIISFIGVILGSLITFIGNAYSSNMRLKEIDKKDKNFNRIRILEKKEKIGIDMIESLYSLHKMNDGLIDIDIPKFKEDSYTILARARIYSSAEVVEIYSRFLSNFFENKEYDGELVNFYLIPAIRKDLGIYEDYIESNFSFFKM